MMTAVEERARAMGVDSVDLDVRALDDEGRAFYRALGYEPTRIYLRRRL